MKIFKIVIGRLAHFWVKRVLQNLIHFLNEDSLPKTCVILKTFKYLLYENGFPEVENSAKYYDLQELLGKKNEYQFNKESKQIQLTQV